jgi:hypothetical protein
MECVQWFKLLLDSPTRPKEFDDASLQTAVGKGLMKLPEGKTAVQVTSAYLRRLYILSITTLKDMIGDQAVDQTPILFSLSLPATWSHAAREATREAAENAGFLSRPRDEMALVDEPECAAIATLKSTIENFDANHAFQVKICSDTIGLTTRANSWQPNTTVLIVDLGGGTADLISYRIVKLDPLQLDEACVGEGIFCVRYIQTWSLQYLQEPKSEEPQLTASSMS